MNQDAGNWVVTGEEKPNLILTTAANWSMPSIATHTPIMRSASVNQVLGVIGCSILYRSNVPVERPRAEANQGMGSYNQSHDHSAHHYPSPSAPTHVRPLLTYQVGGAGLTSRARRSWRTLYIMKTINNAGPPIKLA
jgi:hypothetical protein